MGNANILTICINYHNDDETIDFVKGLLRQQACHDQKIVVVDNSARAVIPNSLLMLRSDKRVLLYDPGENMGYYGGARWGLQQYLKQFPLPDWVVVCNTDINFPTPDFFTKLLRYHSENPPGVIAPDIVLDSQGALPSSETNQNPHFISRPSRLYMYSRRWIYRYYFISVISEFLSSLKHEIGNRLRQEPVSSDRIVYIDDKPFKIYAPYGAFAIFHRSYFNAGGTLDYGSFLFAEEIFVAETVRRLGLTVLYDPRLQIIHKAHTTTGKISSRLNIRFKYESFLYLTDTFFADRSAI